MAFTAGDETLGFLGASGCGKSLTMRCIAGIETPDEGRIVVNGKVFFDSREKVNLTPQERKPALLFQNYMLFPNLTVAQNVAAGIAKDVSPADRDAMVQAELKRFGLSGFEKRYPVQLSGGQQQRVALARALVAEPALLLLDEPLSNLDAKLRESMRFEIKEIQRESGITVLYVTHDQTEAMAMSDRIVVINRGVIQQIGVPRDIYSQPANPFVADFVGKIEFLEGEVKADCIELDGCGQRLPYE